MKRIALRWIAAVSTIAAISALQGARRPRYGGELRIEMREAPRTLDPAESDADALLFSSAVFETLVKLNNHGDPEPLLATSWTHDTARKCWVFTMRANVALHNGTIWPAKPVEISDAKPIEEILRELSRPKNALVIHEPDGTLTGTGPFKIAKWEAGKTATLVAHDAYWGGRPYLDSIDIRMGREYAEQAADFQLGKADVVESQITAKKPNTPSNEVLALQFDARVSDAIREAVALSIDRSAIHRVILQRQGEPSAALLPQWLSGYAFLFSAERNVARAKQLMASPTNLTFSYDAKDPVLRSVAQRIEVDVREAGITPRTFQGSADMRLVRLPVTSRDPMIALEDMAAILKQPITATVPYETERALLDGNRVIPIVHLPKLWSLSSRVHGWPRLADVWLE
jgi:peptide/nickel transport system substrate-binding protein